MFSNLYTSKRSVFQLKAFNKLLASTDWEAFKSLTAEELTQTFQAAKPTEHLKVFNLVQEMASRVLGMRPYGVQLLGGLVLHGGMLAEMRTGEGKTLTIAAPACALALHRKGVHVVTANAYLAKRDAELLRPLYEALGLTVAYLTEDLSDVERQAAYQCDILYGTGSDFGFDYLRDNLKTDAALRVQRPLFAAIVDEVDSILIDEARTPLIISGMGQDLSEMIVSVNKLVTQLEPSVDYTVDLKDRHASLTEVGYDKMEVLMVDLGIVASRGDVFKASSLHLVSRVHAAIQAHILFQKDKDYVVRNGEVMLVDLGTGRVMDGRRLQDGIHEALEAKEGVEIKKGSVTQATITYQNFFTKYEVLSGLTGTALTEAEEFQDIYNLKTVVIPTHLPPKRAVHPDVVLASKVSKHARMAARVRALHEKGQPVLIGFGTIAEAEQFSVVLQRGELPHELLTAKHIGREAEIIANAGAVGAITIATNMAGRGTDIALGGEKPERSHYPDQSAYEEVLATWKVKQAQVIELGGLFVLGGERNGIRRVDNQLAGRCARQGDPGEVQFYLSLEDELIKLFANDNMREKMHGLIDSMGGEMSGKMLSKMLSSAQQKVENQGFSARKELMKYDGVQAKQREVLFDFQNGLLVEGGAKAYLEASLNEAIDLWMTDHMPEEGDPMTWDAATLKQGFLAYFGVELPFYKWLFVDNWEVGAIHEEAKRLSFEYLDSLSLDEGFIREVVFSNIKELWPEHLTAVYNLRESAGYASVIGKNPVLVFQEAAFEAFTSFSNTLSYEVLSQTLSASARAQKEAQRALLDSKQVAFRKVVAVLETRWISRNEPCPCESGLKYKACHGKDA